MGWSATVWAKLCDLRVQLRRDRLDAEPLKRIHQRVRKAVQAVAVLHDAFALHVVEHLAHLLGRKFVVIEKRNEARDGPLEINVVLPERVVGVDEEGLRDKFGLCVSALQSSADDVSSSNVSVSRSNTWHDSCLRWQSEALYATQSTRASGPMMPALWPISSKRATASRPSGP